MFLSLLLAAETAAPAVEPTNTIISISGIVATIVVGIIPCFVTWKVTMRTIQKMRISYTVKIYPIISTKIGISNIGQCFENLRIMYGENQLEDPCLLTLDIANVGNQAIIDPPIKIRSEEDIEIIPGYFDNIPPGYENRWKIIKDTPKCCSLSLEHINPNQMATVNFFINKPPEKRIIFECPMANLQIQHIDYNLVRNKKTAKTVFDSLDKSNIILAIITILLYLTSDQWGMFVEWIIWEFQIRWYPQGVVVFILATLTITLFLNLSTLSFFDKLILNSQKKIYIGIVSIWLIDIILLYLITFDILIVNVFLQTLALIWIALSLSLVFHSIFLLNKNMYIY